MESVVTFAWNGWRASSGISGNFGREYARSNFGGSNKLRPRWNQTLVADIASGESGLVTRKRGEREGRVTVFLFEVEDDDGELVGIHWHSPGFDDPLDAAFSNNLERGPVTPDPEPGIIASVDTGEGRVIEVVRNDPADRWRW